MRTKLPPQLSHTHTHTYIHTDAKGRVRVRVRKWLTYYDHCGCYAHSIFVLAYQHAETG